jgi:FMN phosphatase YigB (HAD superfamily)
VLIENPADAIVGYCAHSLGVSREQFAGAFAEAEPSFQTGAMSEAEFWQRVCGRLGAPLPTESSLWGNALRHAYRPRPELFSLVSQLRSQGIAVAILSNTELPALELYHERHEGLFDQVILSCLEGTRKPFGEIYLLTAERLGVQPAELLFVDDREENVEGARRAGLCAILYSSTEETIAEVKRAVA